MPGAQIPDNNPFGDLQALVNLISSTFGATGNTDTNSSSPEGLTAAMGFLPMLMNMLGQNDFSAGAAEKDSQPAVALLLQQAMENGLPNIQGAESSAGAYDSTTSALLKNDLQARAGAEGAALIAKNKATYGALQTGQANTIIGLINSIINASRHTSTTSTTPNPASNSAGRAALGAAAAGALGKALTKPKPPGAISTKPKPPEALQQLDDPADAARELQNIQDGTNLDDITQMNDYNPGPTPEVTVSNTGNTDDPNASSGDPTDESAGLDLSSFDFGGDLNNMGDANSGDLSGFDLSGDGTTPDDGTDWSFLDGPDTLDDGSTGPIDNSDNGGPAEGGDIFG